MVTTTRYQLKNDHQADRTHKKATKKTSDRSLGYRLALCAPCLLLAALAAIALFSMAEQATPGGAAAAASGAETSPSPGAASSSGPGEPTRGILPAPAKRPNVRLSLRFWAEQLSEQLHVVSNKTNCVASIARYYEQGADFEQLNVAKLREHIVGQMSQLLGQHKSAVDAIVRDAERLAAGHNFTKNLRANYTDVHRLRNKAEYEQFLAQFQVQQQEQQRLQQDFIRQQQLLEQQIKDTSASDALNQNLQQLMLDQWGISGGSQQANEKTTINGGAPVPGPPEWQTPIQTIVLQVNKNFGDIPVNLSMSAVHLPLPIYPGLPEIMNTIAWTEGLDTVFKRNLANFMNVHHQYYGDSSGVLRTFPAHKWRIPRLEPDLFDARTRLWYLAGVSAAKDMVILIDSSGSMTGLRREIAKGVVFELLDTLRNEDYFAVLRFSETVTPVGFPKCNNLKQPRLGARLRDICPQFFEQHQQLLQQQVAAPMLPRNYLLPGPEKQLVDYRELFNDCLAHRRQLDQQGQYLRDHPDLVLGKNATYIPDSAYFKSIKNVTEDIRDSYLLPATSRNIRYLKSNFSMPTAGIANFTHALMAAFELLQAYNRTTDQGAQCNKAIVLITDGAINAHQELFNRYNYPNSPVRVFTYMIGREVGDIKPTKAMACNNRGYYANVINLSEIREQVQKYLPVMLRPAILSNYNHATTWTNAYGDETHQVLTDWVLEVKRRERARLMLLEVRERQETDANSSDIMINIELTGVPEYDELPLVDDELKNRIICEDSPSNDPDAVNLSLNDELDPLGYNELACHWTSRRADLLTSVVKPVYSLRNTSLFFQRVLYKNVWSEQPVQMRNAKLLGVAAVDLRLADLMRLAPSYQLGVNSYAFLVGHHGFVLHHPDLRALLEDPFDKQSKILKPYFNAVDLIHIEQAHSQQNGDLLASGADGTTTKSSMKRQDEKRLMKMRENILKRLIGNESIQVKRAFDCRRRAYIRDQSFYYAPIKDTPYSLGLAVPQSYGLNRLLAKLELSEKSGRHLQKFPRNETTNEKLPTTDLWYLNPDYRYCDGARLQPLGPDQTQIIEALVNQLRGLRARHWESIVYGDLNGYVESQEDRQQLNNKIVCDKDLFPSLLFDAAATQDSSCNLETLNQQCQNSWYNWQSSQEQPWCARSVEEMRHKLAQIYGLELSFVATRSGLTRLKLYESSPRVLKLAEVFARKHDKAIEEPWYMRSVDWNMRPASEDSLLITVPYNANARLIAKLRQRITQRHPMASNDSRSNCDPSWDDDEELTAETKPLIGGDTGGASGGAVPVSTEAAKKALDDFADSLASGVSSTITTTTTRQSLEAKPNAKPTEDSSSASSLPQADEPSDDDEDSSNASTEAAATTPRIDYNAYSSYDFLDLIANSSVHVAATQAIVAHRGDRRKRTPVGVAGLLYDYATFARSFLNSTSLNIEQLPASAMLDDQAESGAGTSDASDTTKVELCPGGECATRCGFRNDTIDCLLVDNNGFIVVAEDLPNVGRSLADYDDRLLASLVDRRIFHAVQIVDYQAICARNENQVQPDTSMLRSASQTMAPSSGSSLAETGGIKSLSLAIAGGLFRNLMSSVLFVGSSLYSMLLYQSIPMQKQAWSPSEWDWWQSASEADQLTHFERTAVVGAQSAFMNQSMQLSLLPNKTYLRPCERKQTLYELSGPSEMPQQYLAERPEYFVTRCGCSGWYVHQQVPKTNLIILVVNITVACRRCSVQADPIASPISLSPLLVADQAVAPSDQQAALTVQQQQKQQQDLQREQLALQANKTAEEQVCSMLERDSQLYIRRQEFCISQHPEEAEIKICGGAGRAATAPRLHAVSLLASLVSLLLALLT